MGGVCDKCGEHCMDCQCMTTQTVDDRETPDRHTQAKHLVETLTADKLPECSFDEGKTWEIDSVAVAEVFSRAAATIKELQAEVERLRSTDLSGKGRLVWAKRLVKTVARAEAAEARAAKAEEALKNMRRALESPLRL